MIRGHVLLRSLLAALGIAGMGVSAYLTSATYQAQSVCELNSFFSCDLVLQSDYSKVMGIPVATLGLVWFGVTTALVLVSFVRAVPTGYLWVWGIVGAVGIPPLLYAELILIGSICLLCTVAYGLGIAILALSLRVHGITRARR